MSAPTPATAERAGAGRDARALRRSWLPWIPLFIVLGLALAVGTAGTRGPTTNEERTTAIARTIKCPICQGESVAESNADLSAAIRLDIAKRVEAGQSDDDVRAYYAGVYGDAVLLTPSASGVAGLVWVLPVVALAVSVLFLVLVFRRWSREPAAHASDADRALVERALDEAHRRQAAGADPS